MTSGDEIDLHMVEIMDIKTKSDLDTELVKGLVLDHGARHPGAPRSVPSKYPTLPPLLTITSDPLKMLIFSYVMSPWNMKRRRYFGVPLVLERDFDHVVVRSIPDFFIILLRNVRKWWPPNEFSFYARLFAALADIRVVSVVH